MAPRVAIYYAPAPNDPLSSRGAAWLGRDPATNVPIPQPALLNPALLNSAPANPALPNSALPNSALPNPAPPGHAQPAPAQSSSSLPGMTMAEITAEPRVYGFHATLKPPMRLLQGTTWADFVAAIRAVAATIAPFDLPPLAVNDLRGFLALRESSACPALQSLADTCVEQPDQFRAPPSPDELARRRKAKLTTEQDAMLSRWGYPYMFGTWFFHMTLTRRLSNAEKTIILPAAEAWFAPTLNIPRRVEDICLFTQATPNAAFTLAERITLRG